MDALCINTQIERQDQPSLDVGKHSGSRASLAQIELIDEDRGQRTTIKGKLDHAWPDTTVGSRYCLSRAIVHR